MIATARQIDLRDFNQRRRAAFHESGHAVAVVSFGCRLRHATIEPTEQSWGHVRYRPPLDPIRYIAVLCAGHLAVLQAQPTHVIPNNCGDMDDIAELVAALLPDSEPDSPAEFVDGAKLACKLVRQHRRAIARIADRLLARNTLDGAAIRRLAQLDRKPKSRQWKT